MSSLRLRALPSLLLAVVLASCSGLPSAQSPGKTTGAQPRRVILISLDGAGAQTLHELYRQGALREGGFERFFRDGEVAEALIPVDPTLTSVNHISLATGFPPAATGIVSNQFHPSGAPSSERASGFDAPIGTETLWEAARRQGRRAGSLGWPGTDAKGERRTAEWGLIYNNAAEFGPQLITLSRADWTPFPAGSKEFASHSPLLATRRKVGGEAEGAETRTLELVALDGTDDGRVNYDRVAAIGEPEGAARRPTAPFQAGAWGLLIWPEPGVSSRLKLVSLAPDLSDVRLFIDGMYRTLPYPEELGRALSEGGLYWPGAPDNAGLAAAWQGKPGIDLDTWTEQAGHMTAFMGEALRLTAAREDWDLLLGYFPGIDQAGHRLLLLDPRQGSFSPERRDDFARARTRVWQAIDAELGKLMAGLDLTRTTVVVVSDHGMTPIHTAVDPNAPIAELGKLAYAVPDGGVAHIHLETGGDARLLADLRSRYAEWKILGEAPVEEVLDRQEAARIGLDHPNSGDLVLFAREGYVFRPLSGGKASGPAPGYGAHGYRSTHPDLHGIYLAVGAGVKKGSSGTVRATEVAPRVAAWLGIDRPGKAPKEPGANR